MEDKLKQGEALFAEGKIEEAEKYFLEILQHDPHNKEALNNLGVIAFQVQEIENAIDYFDKALKIDPFYKEAVLNYVYILKKLNLTTEASSYLYKVVEANPNDKELKQLLNEMEMARKPKIKLAVLCLPGLESFLEDIVNFLQTKYEVRSCYSNNKKEIESAVHWAEIVWLEWANEMAAYVTNNLRHIEKKPVICRVHRYEVFSPFFCKVRWELVDTTIFVAKFMSDLSTKVVPDLDRKTNIRVVYNGVNLKRFKFRENAPGFNLAVVGYIHLRKNPTFWPHILSKLVKIDRRYKLHIAGEYQQAECKLYLEHIIKNLGLEDNIRFYGYQDNIHSWLENKNYLLSTSIHESFGYSIAEAMAMGIKPVIHKFPGSEELWPHHCIFSSIDEAVEMIYKKDGYNSLEYHDFVKQKYSLNSQLKKIERIIDESKKRISKEVYLSTLSSKITSQPQKHIEMPTALINYHKSKNNLIVTGIPRSGTSLMSVLLNNFHNAVCLNEIFYDINSLPRDFAETRRRLIEGKPIPNRYASSGKLTTDTMSDNVKIDNRIIQISDENVVIGSKVNIPYLNHIQQILDYGYKIIAIVRDPVYAIGSWNSEKASIIPEAHVTDGDMHPRWRGFKFASSDKIERQAQIWNFYAKLIWNLRDRIKIYTYELLTSNIDWIIEDICENLGLESFSNMPEIKNQNIDSKYSKIEQIREAVEKYCSIKEVFGYRSQNEKKLKLLRDYQGKTDKLSGRRYDPKEYWERRAKNCISPNSANALMTEQHKIYLRKMINKYSPHSLLEFGAGVGRLFTEYNGIEKLSFCDISPTYQEEAKKVAHRLGLGGDFHLCTSVDVTPFINKEFDIVVAVSILLHQRPEEIVNVMSELARIGHKIVVISWYEQELAVDNITKDTHCYMHDYHSLCKSNSWEMQDIEYAENQIYFTFSSCLS